MFSTIQVAPLSELLTTQPFEPAATIVLRPVYATPEITDAVPQGVADDHESPPLSVVSSEPFLPAIAAREASIADIFERCSVDDEVTTFQEVPPSVVFNIRPYVPHIQPTLASAAAKVIAYKWSRVSTATVFQLLPASVVESTVPRDPTTKAFFESRTKTADNIALKAGDVTRSH